jgi:acyl-[acyl-carrier-protein]-phospholipid O-acyltransferase/long-chain-fatty-acid--[acyl-carrier-protein] ligase
MVSLAAVEAWVARLWPAEAHAVTTLPDPKKGEQLVLVTAHPEPKREELIAFARREGIAELSIPRVLVPVAEVPVLGTGKVDYVKVRALAEDSAAAAGQGAKGDLGDDED